ncbi:MAG: iron-containing alcohol dehydrogenase [Actinomycetia bacterium]|nr:iron-containing alcohol dehydrogenase [Actinomycetes bacterium]
MERDTVVQAGPGRYLHGAGTAGRLGELLRPYGTRWLVVTGRRSWDAAREAVEAGLRASGGQWAVVRYGGECSEEAALRVLDEAGPAWDAVVGVGGGKVLDLSKVVARALRVPLATVPTLASNCAATTPVAVVYGPDGAFKTSRVLEAPPAVTVVDDAILARAPWRYFVSGIGDTLAKPYEAAVGAGANLDVLARAGLALAELAGAVITAKGPAAVEQAVRGEVGPEAREVTDAVLLLGGMVGGVGGDACRAAAAHAVHNGLTLLAETHAALHGEKVAYGLLVQEVLLGHGADGVRRLAAVLRTLRLPDRWQALTGGRPLPDRRVLAEVARKSLAPDDTMHRMPRVITVEDVVEAFLEVERVAGGA